MAEKPSAEWLAEMIKDEEMAAKEYDKYGLYNLARDEARHRQILERILQQEGHRRFT
jgi:rubrerythrin